VGFFTFVVAMSRNLIYIKTKSFCLNSFLFLALLHEFGNNSITIRNSLIIGDITQDCTDLPDTTTLSAQYSLTAIPIVSATSSAGDPGGRSGVSFPYFSGNNLVPHHPWTCVSAYPASK
jgi:hypothetical protein